jgi:hypothetical protein
MHPLDGIKHGAPQAVMHTVQLITNVCQLCLWALTAHDVQLHGTRNSDGGR